MTYNRLIVGDPSIVRVWQAAQLAKAQLVGVVLKPSSCLDTLTSGLSDVSDELDFVIVSVLTHLLTEEASASDVRGTCGEIICDVAKIVFSAAKKSTRVEVDKNLFKFYYILFWVRLSAYVFLACFLLKYFCVSFVFLCFC